MTPHACTIGAIILCVAVTISCGARLPRYVSKDCAADVILVIDKSGSMGGSYGTVLQFSKALVSGFDFQSRVGIIVFDHVARIEVPIGGYVNKADLLRKIDRLPRPGGGTAIYRGVAKMHDMFRADQRFADKSHNRFTAIVITDGQDGSLGSLQAAASAAHSDGINIISIGVGSVNTQQIKAMASDPEFALIRPSVSQIGDLYDKVVKFTCEAVRPGVRRGQRDECYRASYTHGQLWLPYKPNCHQYIVCEPRGPGKYTKHVMSCGALYWNQKLHACMRSKTGDCEDAAVVTYTGPPPTDGPCPYKRDPRNPSDFYSVSDPREVQDCPQGQEFSEEKCTCLVVVGQVVPTCSNDLLLHFDFENDFNDVTCHHAVANKYGNGTVSLTADTVRTGKVARFDGRGYLEVPFIRTWFANNHVDAFTISLWFNRLGRSDATYGALVNNGDSVENAGFSLRATENNKLVGKIRTKNGEKSLTVDVPATNFAWHHVAYVYDGQQMTIFVDRTAVNTVAISGYMVNNDVPMNVGFDDEKYFFDGLMDELRVYTRALSAAEIVAL